MFYLRRSSSFLLRSSAGWHPVPANRLLSAVVLTATVTNRLSSHGIDCPRDRDVTTR